MPDITMCADEQCPKRKTCYRFIAAPSGRQAYFMGSPMRDGACEYYIEAKARSQVRRLDAQTGRGTEKINFTP